jgi:dihydroorotase
MKVYPPVRRSSDQDALWEAVRDGVITSIGSDHAPHTTDEKNRDFATQPAGAVGVETLVRVLLNEMIKGAVSAERLAWVLSEGTARLYGIYPRKGAVLPGSDADFTLVDPDAEWRIRNADLHSKHPLSPWHGFDGRGVPQRVLLRGRTIMHEGELIGDPGGALVLPMRIEETTLTSSR